jgi:hypothetical protein
MNFAQAVQAVIDITKRPDKQIETERAVNAALSFFILKAEFPQDLLEATLPISATEYTGQVSIAGLTRFRRMKFVNISGERNYLKPIAPEQLFTPGGSVQPNTYYLTSNYLNYSLAKLASALKIGYYSYPPTLTANDTHWFLDAASPCIIDRAAGVVFKVIGDDSSMGAHMGFAKEWYDAFVRDLAQP